MESAKREQVRHRAAERCEYCGLPQSAVPLAPFQVEHVIARQHLGSDELSNLALACDRCNLYKGPNLSSIDPETGAIVEMFNPRRDVWNEHFRVQEGVIYGLTAKGRATARLLNMNAKKRVKLRREST
jgi:hypothetical protein